ncbi:hypothetical protein P280DRAFT_249075 [Massarina eburnea CBS 473.64]|uniref:Zn(2)-C6 fungal-type domain-containing protein n=1 Tax=Massarina eburnea CBS 473.64 TaxID=1395130 RepID=A0A6A6SAV1_9PLEO|nr:hypothetical protein P280DRAFT_249075 [Massarina eburnea CBS 473.64]
MVRSRTGCLTCRQRKLKCDEKKPVCGQCCKASRECVPSSGIVFRHQHNASMNGDDSGDENTLKGFYAYKNTFDDDTIWMDIPKQVTFINTTNPYLDPFTPDFDNMSTASVDSPPPFEPRPPITSWPTSNNIHTVTSTPSSTGPDMFPTSAPMCFTPELEALPPLERSSFQSPPTSSAGTPISPQVSLASHFPSYLNHAASMTPPPIDPRLGSPFDADIPRSTSFSTRRRTPSSGSDFLSERDHEIAFLLRYFSEGPGYWMDLFDLGTYFSSYVPVKARENPLLKYAAVAYAAKALARVQGRKPVMGGSVSRQARMEMYPDSQSVDWYHKATQYYDTAVSLLLQALKHDSISFDSDSDRESSHGGEPPATKRRKLSNTSFKSNTDELLAASAILCVYEFLDASVPEWAKHLNGAKSLLVIAQERMMPLQMPTPNSMITSANLGFISKARRATFWNIARQDMLAAFINKTHTRLDTEDLTIWKEAGLLLDDNGFIIASNTTESGYPEGESMMKEDLICNALIWLMSKLVNFMAAGDNICEDFSPSFAGVTQRTLLDFWQSLQRQFQVWHDGLPITFKPCARVDTVRSPGGMIHEDEPLFPEVWYSIPMCASTMQAYHMSQIQLLMNKPHESTQGRTTVSARLNSYQSVLAACQVHSREIVGISLSRCDEAVRIHSVQPLFTAGQCLIDPRERQVVLDLLRGIEADIGWATEYRVRALIEQWHFEEHDQMIT